MGFNKLEVKLLKLINKTGFLSKNSIMRFLMSDLVLSKDIAMEYYTLWFLNYREDGKYEETTNVNRELTPLLNILLKLKSDDISFNDIPDKYLGDKFYWCSSKLPCIDFERGDIVLNLDRDTWEEENISGLHEEDLWKFYEAYSNYSGYYEEYDSEEFNYFQFNEETLNLIKEIAVNANRKNVIDFLDDNTNPPSEDLANYLSEMLPVKKFNEIVDDYLSDIGYITSMERQKSVRVEYEEEIKYNVSMGGNEYSLYIPLDEFIEIVRFYNPLTFSDIIDEEIRINPSVYLDEAWSEAGYWDSDDKEHIENLNRNLQNIVDDFSEEGNTLSDYYKKLSFIENLFKETGINYISKDRWGNKHYSSKDGRLKLTGSDIDVGNEKITFFYDNEKHTVPFDNFIGWAQGSILDIKNESVRYGKIPFKNYNIITEGRKSVTKISIFDFDGTLADTPNREDGIPMWEVKTGKEYPHLGWYSKRESLDSDIFNIKLIPTTIIDYVDETTNPNTLLVMLTGRMPNQSDQVESILNKKGIVFDEYHYKERGDTFTSKINTIKKLLSQNPNVSQIEMWEDRLNHADGFEQWGQQNGVNIKVNRIT